MIVYVYINHGRWVVDCPDCNTSWLVDAAAPTVLVDAQGNPHHACFCGAALAAQFPSAREEIEERLLLRPVLNRNWRAGESVADLRIENAAHGVSQ